MQLQGELHRGITGAQHARCQCQTRPPHPPLSGGDHLGAVQGSGMWSLPGTGLPAMPPDATPSIPARQGSGQAGHLAQVPARLDGRECVQQLLLSGTTRGGLPLGDLLWASGSSAPDRARHAAGRTIRRSRSGQTCGAWLRQVCVL